MIFVVVVVVFWGVLVLVFFFFFSPLGVRIALIFLKGLCSGAGGSGEGLWGSARAGPGPRPPPSPPEPPGAALIYGRGRTPGQQLHAVCGKEEK